MTMVWSRHLSPQIREIGYDIAGETMAVVFKDTTIRYYAPVSYSLYSMLAHAPFPERLYKGIVEGKIPRISGPALKRT
jgi:hypothetical protein